MHFLTKYKEQYLYFKYHNETSSYKCHFKILFYSIYYFHFKFLLFSTKKYRLSTFENTIKLQSNDYAGMSIKLKRFSSFLSKQSETNWVFCCFSRLLLHCVKCAVPFSPFSRFKFCKSRKPTNNNVMLSNAF